MTGLSTQAQADTSLTMAFTEGRPLIDLRLRYENVDDATKTPTADALTARARLGFQTGDWNGLSALFDFDQIWTLGADNYNSTRNGKTAYPVVADPTGTALNRLQLTYASDFDTSFTLGRQRIIFDNSRFVGNVGWRQHEQTYDAISLVNKSIPNLSFSYAYVWRVNRVFGPQSATVAGQTGFLDGNSHFINAAYTGIPDLKAVGYAYLLDFDNGGFSRGFSNGLSTATYGLRGEYSTSLGYGIGAKLTGEFAHQTDYGHNPATFNLNYWFGEGMLKYKTASVSLGYESMEGNGARGFATPLATLHAFDGWADQFLTTPANGLTDLYAKAAYTFNDVPVFSSIAPAIVYHAFNAEHVSAYYGSEWDAIMDFPVDKNLSFEGKYASFTDNRVFKDKKIGWLMIEYKY